MIAIYVEKVQSLCAHNTIEQAIIFIRWTGEAIAIGNRLVKEGGICITAFPWNWFWINVSTGV